MHEQLEFVNCILCSRDEADVFIRDSGPTRIVRCRNDGLLYMNPRPKTSVVRMFHTNFVRGNNLALFDQYRRAILRREAEAVKEAKSGGNLLDVGCATGTFFESFSNVNWRLYGVDTSSLGVELARTKHNADVFRGTFQEARYPNGFFDVVTMLDTLYYSPDPAAELREAKRILRTDGLLALEVPGLNYGLLRDRGVVGWLLDGRRMKRWASSYHLYYFSAVTIRLLLESAGFRVIRMIPEQASLGRGSAGRALNEMHFALARLLFKASAGRFSIAGKELYLAVKKPPSLLECPYVALEQAAEIAGREGVTALGANS